MIRKVFLLGFLTCFTVLQSCEQKNQKIRFDRDVVIESEKFRPANISGLGGVPLGSLIDVKISKIEVQEEVKSIDLVFATVSEANGERLLPEVVIEAAGSRLFLGVELTSLANEGPFRARGYETGKFAGLAPATEKELVSRVGLFSSPNTGTFRWRRVLILTEIVE